MAELLNKKWEAGGAGEQDVVQYDRKLCKTVDKEMFSAYNNSTIRAMLGRTAAHHKGGSKMLGRTAAHHKGGSKMLGCFAAHHKGDL